MPPSTVPSTETSEPPTMPTTSTIAPTAPTGPLRVTEGMTPPGTRLQFGQRAVVPFRSYNSFSGTYSEGVLGIVVEPIQQIPGDQIVGNFDPESRNVLNSSTGYYTRITITNEGTNDLSSALVPRFDLRTAGGGEPDVALIGGEAAGCPEMPGAPTPFGRGATWVTCVADASSPSRPLTEVHYLAPPYGEEIQLFDDPPPRFNQYYSLGAIVWS